MSDNVHFSSKTDLWSTPQDFFDRLNAAFDFTLDVCATHDNAKCANYFTKECDGLAQEWRGRVWMNPPYGREIGAWVRHLYQRSAQIRGFREQRAVPKCLSRVLRC